MEEIQTHVDPKAYEWNQTYVDHEAYEWKGSYTYPSIVGGSLHLQVGIISLPSFRSRCNIPPNFPLVGKLMDGSKVPFK